MKLAIFDFDGTITTKDSFEDFIFYCHGLPKTFLGMTALAPVLILYILKLWPNWKAKQRVFARFYQGWEETAFKTVAAKYASEKLSALLRPAAMERLQWHKEQGHKIVIVSASFEAYLQTWCARHGFDLLGTLVEIKNGKVTGQFASKNCHGVEKIERLKACYRLEDFEYIYAYGDTKGDLPLATIANDFQYKPFR